MQSNNLERVVPIRMFKDDKKRAEKIMKLFPARFSSYSHFIRCAQQVYIRQLETEYIDQKVQHERPRNSRKKP